LACSLRNLSIDDIESALALKQIQRPVESLLSHGILCRGPRGEGVGLVSQLHKDYCRSRLSGQETEYICQQLLVFESQRAHPDPLQILALRLWQGQSSQASELVQEVKHDLLERWDPEILSSLPSLLKLFDEEVLHPLRSLWGLLSATGESADSAVFRAWSRARRLSAEGRESRAATQWMKLSKMRGVTPAMRAYGLMQASLAFARVEDPLGFAKAAREFERVDLQNLSTRTLMQWKTLVATASANVGRDGRTESDLPDDMAGWLAMARAWYEHRFEDSAGVTKASEAFVESLHDAVLKGDGLKLLGNVAYRTNRPDPAIVYYARAERCYAAAKHQAGIDRLAFNRATSEKLAGRFHRAAARFEGVLEHARKKRDESTCCQCLYNMAVIACLSERDHADRMIEEHAELARKLRDPEEQARNLILQLHRAWSMGVERIADLTHRLEALMGTGDYDPLIRDEARFALRLGRFAQGMDLTETGAESEDEPGRYTAWRHAFLDWLSGGQASLTTLLDSIGSRLFAAYHFYLLRQAIAKGLVPLVTLSQELADRIKQHGEEIGWVPRQFFRTHFRHLRKYVQMPHPYWEQLIELYEQMPAESSGEKLRRFLLTRLKEWFPFDDHGRIEHTEHGWYGDQSSDGLVIGALQRLEIRMDQGPLVTRIPLGRNGYGHLLLLPVGSSDELYWFLDEQGRYEPHPPLDPLFRFFNPVRVNEIIKILFK